MIVDCSSRNLSAIGKVFDISFESLNTTYSHLVRRMIASVASTMLRRIVSDHNWTWMPGDEATHLFSVIIMRSPKSLPQYNATCSPPQSKKCSNGTKARKETGEDVKKVQPTR